MGKVKSNILAILNSRSDLLSSAYSNSKNDIESIIIKDTIITKCLVKNNKVISSEEIEHLEEIIKVERTPTPYDEYLNI